MPEPFLSTEVLFSTLEWSTEPQYRMTWTEEGDCDQDFRIRAGGDTACWNCDYDNAVGVSEDSGGVTVVATQRVGPYETITLQASSSDELLAWLQDREFSLPETLAPACIIPSAGSCRVSSCMVANKRCSSKVRDERVRVSG